MPTRAPVSPLQMGAPIIDPKSGAPTLQFLDLINRLLGNEGVTNATAAGAAPQARVIASGGGLTGGGDLTADRTLAVGAGTGIVVNADDVAADPEYIRDTVASFCVAGANMTITHNDGADTLEFAAAGGSGSAWDFAPPAAAGFTLFSGDATSATLTDDTDVGLIVTTSAAANTGVVRGGYKALPAVGTDFSVVMKFSITAPFANFIGGGLAMYESATGKAHLLFGAANASDSLDLRRQTIAGTFSSDVKVAIPFTMVNIWVRMRRVGANLLFDRSNDGKNWLNIQTIAQNTYLTTAPDRIGPIVWLTNASNIPIMNVMYWAQTGF